VSELDFFALLGANDKRGVNLPSSPFSNTASKRPATFTAPVEKHQTEGSENCTTFTLRPETEGATMTGLTPSAAVAIPTATRLVVARHHRKKSQADKPAWPF